MYVHNFRSTYHRCVYLKLNGDSIESDYLVKYNDTK